MLAEDRQVGTVERLLHLRRAPVIGSLDPDDLAVIAEASRPRTFKVGERLLDESTRSLGTYFIVEGRVHLERQGRAVGHATPGSALGGVGILAHSPPGFTAVAESDVLALELDADAMLEVLDENYSILRHLLRAIAGQIVEGSRALPSGRKSPMQPAPHELGARRDLDLVDRIYFLRQTPVFASVSSNALAELARGLSEVHFPAGIRLWTEGEPARHLLLVVDGRLECAASTGFRLTAGAGSPLGAVEALAGLSRWYTVETATPVVALNADIELLFDVLEDNSEMAIRLLETLSRWLIGIAGLVAEHDPRRLVTMGIVGVADPEPPGHSGAIASRT